MNANTPSIPTSTPATPALQRRDFLKVSGLAALPLALGGIPLAHAARPGHVAGIERLRLGLIGCGGRGSGAASDLLEASPITELVAMGDVFADRVQGSLSNLKQLDGGRGERVKVADEHLFTGFDSYKKVLAADVDLVILATPPGFRPTHFQAAIAAGKHVFMEKPVAVDATGVRTVVESARIAEQKKLAVVSGTQRRHEKSYLEAVAKLQAGEIGKIVSARCYWNQGGLWMHPRKPEWSDMEWQLRNWLYFTWLSGDHIVEQHVHNIDVCNWLLGTPVKCWATGGRQARTDAAYGHVFDHFAVEYEYANGVVMHSYCRQQDGTPPRVEECFVGERGNATLQPGRANVARFDGSPGFRFKGDNNNPYVQEQIDLVNSIVNGTPLNEGVRIAESTLTAIMGRMSAYTGKPVTWEQAMSSKLNLMPATLEMGPLPTPDVAIPGKTPLI